MSMDFKKIIGSGLSPSNDSTPRFGFEIDAFVNIDPTFEAATLGDSAFVWTKPSGGTFTGKAPVASNFTEAGIYYVTCTNWASVRQFNAESDSVVNLDFSEIAPLLTSFVNIWARSNPWYTIDVHDLPALTALSSPNRSVQGITSVNITNCLALDTVDLDWTNMLTAVVDSVLQQCVDNGVTTGDRICSMVNCGVPSAAGLANKVILESRGWTVTVESDE